MSTPEGTFGDPVAPAPRVTRNNPPKRVRLGNINIVTGDGESYSEGDEVILEGPTADEYQMQGLVTIIERVPDAKGFDYKPADDHEVEHDVTQQRQEQA
jgi:hypothetical protein